jgi:hypothetical protein
MKNNKIGYDKTEVRSALEEFYKLYEKRPVRENEGGMKSPHLFNTWYSLKKLNPKLIIESGVWKGLGTWIIEQACPKAKIISIELDYSHLEYKSPTATYLDKDITTYPWDMILADHHPTITKDEIVIFLDDHQNFLNRLEFLSNLGMKHILYEDNYPPLQGDTFSPKKILACRDYIMDYAGKRSLHQYSYFDYERFLECVETYQELSPIFKTAKTRWGDDWDETNYPTKAPFLTVEDADKFPTFWKEASSYTWICYMGLK